MPTDKKALLFNGISLIAILYLLTTGPLFIQNLPFLFMQIFGILLIFWALLASKVNKHRHEDKLPKGTFLITKGPYEIIRHPIYAGLLLIMAGFAQGYITIPRFIAFAVILFFVLMKIIYDESILDEHVKEYEEYKKKTHRLIPYFF